MKQFLRTALRLSPIVIVIFFGLACDDEDNPRSIVTISRLADPAWPDTLTAGPFLSDVVDAGPDQIPGTADDIYFEDILLLTVQNEPASDLLVVKPDRQFGFVTIESYRVEFDLPGEKLAPIESSLHLKVPSGDKMTASIVLVTAQAKTLPPLSSLVASREELLGHAKITIHGHEQTSDDPVTAEARIQVHFADWAD